MIQRSEHGAYHGEVRGNYRWDSALQAWNPTEKDTPGARCQRQRRVTAMEQGMCSECCCRPALPNGKLCNACRTRSRENYHRMMRLARQAQAMGMK